MPLSYRPKQYEIPWPYTGALYGSEEEEALVRLVRDAAVKRRPLDRRSPEIVEFERRFAAYIGAAHAVSLSSGGAALELATRILGIGLGDELAVSALTFKATVLPIVVAGARPIPIDIDYETLNIDFESFESCVTPKTKAIYLVDYAGLPLNPEAVMQVAGRNGIPVVEDAAHSLGSAYGAAKCGSWADLSCFSFQSQKNISTLGEGGMLTTNDEHYAERARALRNYDHDVQAGGNYRLSAAQCAVGIEQLKRLDSVNAKRRAIARRMSYAFRDVPGFGTPFEPDGVTHACHMYPCRLDGSVFGPVRDTVRKKLLDEYAVETSFQYEPWYDFPVIRAAMGDFEPCPVMERVARELFGLPIFPGYTDDEVGYIIWAVKEVLSSL
ncbi:MAG: DegT/DnrJ/EryC1/StrS family aminotransferase [bacterium]